jgi:ABC-type Na+ efflux pump permease subunit
MANSLWGTAVAVAAKDLRIEWRTKTAFASSIVFAVLVLAVFYFSRDPSVVTELDIAPAALWVTFTFAAMLGLNRAFLLEKENRALDGLLLTPVPRTGIFLGKLLGNLGFVVVVELISLPLFARVTCLAAAVGRNRNGDAGVRSGGHAAVRDGRAYEVRGIDVADLAVALLGASNNRCGADYGGHSCRTSTERFCWVAETPGSF